jgi:hypothetical protein
MKYITLIKELSEKDAELLRKIGIKIDGLKLGFEEDGDTYFTREGINYSIYCYDDKHPVASFTIKNDTWDPYQDYFINEKNIEIALKRMQTNLDQNTGEYPSYKERKKMINEGNYQFLLKIPFSELRFDEQNIVKKKGYKYENEDNFHPLTSKGLKIIELIRSTRSNLDGLKERHLDRERDYKDIYNHHISIWNSLLDGTHELTSGFTEDQILGYFSIVKHGFAPAGFEEPSEEKISNLKPQVTINNSDYKHSESEISSSFLMDILASRELKALAFGFILAGAIVLIGLGSGGVVPLAIGGAALGVGLLLGAVGLFSSCTKESSDGDELQNRFLADVY